MVCIPECTLCGKNADKLFLVKVEGSKIEVCEECTKFGEVVEEVRPVQRKVKSVVRAPQIEGPEEILKSNYGKLILKVRQKMGLERKDFAMEINEKESVIKRVELEQMVPDEKLQKKIEKFLDIELTEAYEEKKIERKIDKNSLTLGDIVEIE